MRLLLDTHALLWWVSDDERLSLRAYDAIDSSRRDVFVSAVSAYEVAQKVTLGKMPSFARLAPFLKRVVTLQGFSTLGITFAHAQSAGELPMLHRDPFDRLLIAQSHVEGLTLVSNEELFDSFGVSRLW